MHATQSKVLAFQGNPTTDSSGSISVAYYQHQQALQGRTNGFGRSLIRMLTAWEEYAIAHEKEYECSIGNDGIIGHYWATIGLEIKQLLNGETGGLDCGSVSHNITSLIESKGFKTDGYELQ